MSRKPVIDIKAQAKIQREKLKQSQRIKEVSIKEKLILSLINIEIDEKTAENAASYVLKKSAEASLSELMSASLQYIEEKKKNKNTVRKSPTTINKLEKIINKGNENKKSAYETLLEEGYIKNPINDFII